MTKRNPGNFQTPGRSGRVFASSEPMTNAALNIAATLPIAMVTIAAIVLLSFTG